MSEVFVVLYLFFFAVFLFGVWPAVVGIWTLYGLIVIAHNA